VKRARLELAAEDTLDFVPPWLGARLLALAEAESAMISLTGPGNPEIFAGIPPGRAGRDQLPFLKEVGQVVGRRAVNWTVAPCPTPGWARKVHPDLDEEAALERLWNEVEHVMRLDTPDPVAAWKERLDTIRSVSDRLTAARFDAVRFDGPGTELTIGLLPSSRWTNAGRFETVFGVVHVPNIPSEECFTAPDPERADGVVRATRPLDLQGTRIDEFTVRFEGGRAVGFEGENADALAARARLDDAAARLGEVALVDAESRVGRLGTVFGETLIDENAVSHVALGNSFPFAVDEADVPRINQSVIHVDFMIGGDDVDVTGIRGGDRVPILRGGVWQV
jgi:aminopeptidase